MPSGGVHPIADQKPGGRLPGEVIGFDGPGRRRWFARKDSCHYLNRTGGAGDLSSLAEGNSRVRDVIHDQHLPTDEAALGPREDHARPGAFTALPIGGEPQCVVGETFSPPCKRSGEIGCEPKAA